MSWWKVAPPGVGPGLQTLVDNAVRDRRDATTDLLSCLRAPSRKKTVDGLHTLNQSSEDNKVIMTINRRAFYDAVRGTLFSGNLNSSQVDGMDKILNLWESILPVDLDVAGLAYIFATNWWEARLPPDWRPRMQPVSEVGQGAGRPYGNPDPVTGFVYYGRGDVQLTWADNYKRLGAALGVDLYHNPEQALDPTTSKTILVKGMIGGLYSPAAGPLKRYFPLGGTPQFVAARAMVNGSDHANDIAELARKFHAALAETP